jgi:hypothetical protein
VQHPPLSPCTLCASLTSCSPLLACATLAQEGRALPTKSTGTTVWPAALVLCKCAPRSLPTCMRAFLCVRE